MPKTTTERAAEIAKLHFGLDVVASRLDGYDDENFKLVDSKGNRYLLKLSTVEHLEALRFQVAIMEHLDTLELDVDFPKPIVDRQAHSITQVDDQTTVRLMTWLPGRVWAEVNPKTTELRQQLGAAAGQLTNALVDFKHEGAHRNLDWDLANSLWIEKHLHLFSDDEKQNVKHFQQLFLEQQQVYSRLPKQIIHNDLNDYNIFVSEDYSNPKVSGIIDFGDSVYTQSVNDVAILLAYACMHLPDPLSAACEVLEGYQQYYHFSKEELKCLYTLVGMRLVVTVTSAAIKKQEFPDDEYFVISEKPAWELLKKWVAIHPDFAHYSFRKACGYTAHPKQEQFQEWMRENKVPLSTLFPTLDWTSKTEFYNLDMSVGSGFIGNRSQYQDIALFEFRFEQLRKRYPNRIFVNGYMEPRVFYTTDSYKKLSNSGYEHRTRHLGIDVWLPAETPVHTPFDAVVKIVQNNAYDKDYGPMIILEHQVEDVVFYSLYGHLSLESLEVVKSGQKLKQGELIGYLGNSEVNGHWPPHLHFQLIMDLMGQNENFDGVALPSQEAIWRSLCPNPNLIFQEDIEPNRTDVSHAEIQSFRKEHLGRSLSLSYDKPLHIVRGEGVYLIDANGQKYLDTVNNVAHVGHEHPKVVERGQEQMAVLNTNTRYLHESIVDYADALLKKLPPHLSVLHFVNSGSEANELALRMAKTVTGQKDILAIEVGYHGNTNTVMEVSSYKFDGPGGNGKPEYTHILPLPDPFRGRHRGKDSGQEYARYAQEQIESIGRQGRGIAGFIGENIVSCGGQIVPPKDYFKHVYEYVHQAGGLCIADEVQTGFGRMGDTFWAFELFDVKPDIVTMGKPAGNGHPLAVVACTQEVADKFNNGIEYFNTFGGNPVSCAIGKAVLDVIEEEGLQENARVVGGYLKQKLEDLKNKFPIVADVRGHGLFLGFELTDANMNPLSKQASYLANRMRDHKILMSTDGLDNNVLKIKPPLIFSIADADTLLSVLECVLEEDYMRMY